MSPSTAEAVSPIALAAREGLLSDTKTLPPWLFYDEAGSELFEQITELPEYYLTRTERLILERSTEAILNRLSLPITVAELGAGTATKTGLILRAAAERQGSLLYQPIDVSASALEQARRNIMADIPGVQVAGRVANYVSEGYRIERPKDHAILALYIGSSIGNFSPAEARTILSGLRAQLRAGDHLLLGTDLAPGANKPVDTLIAAYDDAAGVTAAFNRNILTHLNRELGTDFNSDCFRHVARWNAAESRMEMHLEATAAQTVRLPADVSGPAVTLRFVSGETIHTENSYKFTIESLHALLTGSGFATVETFTDPEQLFALTLAAAV